jgi:hypothetical protein
MQQHRGQRQHIQFIQNTGDQMFHISKLSGIVIALKENQWEKDKPVSQKAL